MIRDISDWERAFLKTGSRDGFWVRDPLDQTKLGLVKFPGTLKSKGVEFATGEVWAEALASVVGSQLGLDVPLVEVVEVDSQVAVLVWSFLPPLSSLREGVDEDIQAPRHRKLSIDDIVQHSCIYIGHEAACSFVAHMVFFDVLIGNTDRHQGNWGVILLRGGSNASARMAPYYDNGSAFGSRLDPDRVENELSGHLARFNSGFRYEVLSSSTRDSSISSCLEEAAAILPGDEFADSLAELTDETIQQLVDSIDCPGFDQSRMDFCTILLASRRDLILRYIGGRRTT